MMIKNYVKTTYRNILRNKMFSLINIAGLAFGLAVGILILQYVMYELSYDKFQPDREKVYRLEHDRYDEGKFAYHFNQTVRSMGPTLKKDFPEVVEFCRITRIGGGVVTVEDRDRIFKTEKIYFVDSSFFKMFSIQLVKGNPETALSKPHNVIISEYVAKKIFGDEDPLYKTFRFDWYNSAVWRIEITGVFKDPPKNSHLKYDFLFSNHHILSWWPFKHGWKQKYFFTYIKLAPNTNPKLLEAKLPGFVDRYMGYIKKTNKRDDYSLHPIGDIYLHSDPGFAGWTGSAVLRYGDLQAVYIMSILALIILLIAWVNYINLSTVRSIDRAREVGMRKVLGANRHQLVKQFLFESFLLNILAFIAAIILSQFLITGFNQLFGLPSTLSLLAVPTFWLTITGILIIGATISGIYPAFVLSSPNTIGTLKGKQASSKNVTARKLMVIFQFVICIALIAGALTLYKQVGFMRNQTLGFSPDNVLLIERPVVLKEVKDFAHSVNTFIAELERYTSICCATTGSVPGLSYQSVWTGMSKDGGAGSSLKCCWVNYNFLETFQIKLLAGRNFSKDFSTDKEKGVILNEAAVNLLGFESPENAVDQTIFEDGKESGTIIGVVKNYHQESLKKAIEPTMFRFPGFLGFSYFAVRLNTDNYKEAINIVKEKWDTIFPGNLFVYHHLDEFFDKQYDTDRQFEKKLSFFTFFAVIIACLGLFGLASYSTAQRTKEIGIRKVHGADVFGIILLFLKDFFKLLFIAILGAFPVSYLVFAKMLENYAYRINIGWWFVVIPILITVPIIILTVIYQIVKAAMENPVHALRYE